MPAIEWLGCATFRVRIGELTLFFDTFVDRIAAAEPVGVHSDEIDDADFVFISHTHLDHVLGADAIARNTGAPVIGSYETMRVMKECGVGEDQRWAVSGGETVDCGNGATVRVLPSLHACLWAAREDDAGAPCLGDHGEIDLRGTLRQSRDDEPLRKLFLEALRLKPLEHQFRSNYAPGRPMTAIGG